MKDKIQKWIQLEQGLASQRGAFELFALFLREDAQDKWDLLVAAPWLQDRDMKALKSLAEEIQGWFSKEDLLNLSRIVIIDESNPALRALQQAIHVEHGSAEVKDSNFFGLPIKHAYIITSQRPNTMIESPAT